MKDPTRFLKDLSYEARRRLIEGAVQNPAPTVIDRVRDWFRRRFPRPVVFA